MLAAAGDPPALGLNLRDADLGDGLRGVRAGTFGVYENRDAQSGRVLQLDVVVIAARKQPALPDPVFYFAGGPGQNAAAGVRQWVGHWMNADRDVVLISQRGTGGDNRLQCDLAGDDDDLQGYLDDPFDPKALRACLETLRKRADLTQYSTPIAMDDIDNVRQALGYAQINLFGGSYGSRAMLVYLQRHPESVRCAIMNSVAPLAFRNPLYHAEGAQAALDEVFRQVEEEPRWREVFGELRAKFDAVMRRLEARPAEATVKHPRTGAATKVRLSRDAFAEGLRVTMYVDSADVPLIIQRAYEGDFDLIAQWSVERARSLRASLAFGMLLCVTCAEDVARIDPDEIEALTRDTYLGDGRVRRQIEICRVWPKSRLPDDWGAPVSGAMPVLFLSGRADSVTPPRWGAEAARHFPSATHVVAPGAHGVGGPCIDSLMRAFLEDPTRPLDTGCVERMRAEPFRLPE